MPIRVLPSFRKQKFVVEDADGYVSFSRYGKIVVSDDVENGLPVRILTVNGTRESATYRDEAHRDQPVFDYLKVLCRLTAMTPGIRTSLLIGGAGCTFPRYYLRAHPEKRIDVVEQNEEMLTIARKYFYLEELFSDPAVTNGDHLRLFVDDGLRYLKKTDTAYDLIINDAFVGRIADKGLQSDAGMALVKKRLAPDGIYAINVITALRGESSMPGLIVTETARQQFRYVSLFPVRTDDVPQRSQNCMLLASDKPLLPEEALQTGFA